MKTCYIVAGPNGAGKSTFAQSFLPGVGCLKFINVDLIAAGISPLKPGSAMFEAGRIFFHQMDRFAETGETFGFESTLSGSSYANRISRLKKLGYRIVLYYLWIPSVEIAIRRVRRRVIEGGHDVPEFEIRRRFFRSWSNFEKIYQPLADHWIVFDNVDNKPIVIAESK